MGVTTVTTNFFQAPMVMALERLSSPTCALGAAVLLHALAAARAWNVAPQASGFGPGTHSRGARWPIHASLGEPAPAGAMRPVVLCPAQFGTAEDYTQLKHDLRARGFDLYAAPLRRFDWFKIVPATLTMDFVTASLKPAKTLGFFYEALDKAFAQVESDYTPYTLKPKAYILHTKP